MEKAGIAATAVVALLLPTLAPREAGAIGLLLPAVQKVREAAHRTPAEAGTYGFAFEVLEPLRIDALGTAVGADPRGGTVTIWDSHFQLIVSADISAARGSERFSFDWAEVDPLLLAPGTYVIGATYLPGGRIPVDVEGLVRPDIRWLEGRQGIGEGALPRERADDFGPLGVLWANFATAIPEPASWAMMIAGFGLIGMALRRRRASLLQSAGEGAARG